MKVPELSGSTRSRHAMPDLQKSEARTELNRSPQHVEVPSKASIGKRMQKFESVEESKDTQLLRTSTSPVSTP